MKRQILSFASLLLGAVVGLWAQSSVVLDGSGSKLELKNNAELQLSGSAGAANQLLVSQGSGATPTWKSLNGAAGEITITPSPTALTVGLANTGVTPGTYGSATQVAQITVDAKGRITSATNVTISGVSPGGPAGGDLTGTYPNPTVAKIQGNPVASGTLGAGDAGKVLLWNGSQWTAASITPSGPAGGDLDGSYPNPTVDGLCGTPLNCSAIGALGSGDRKVLTWNGSAWVPWGIVGDGTTTVTAGMGNFTISANNTSAIWNADKLRGNPVASGTLGAGDAGKVLLWTGSQWAATGLSGDIASVSGTGEVELSPTGVAAGTYGSETHVAQITVDAKGRIISATNVPISGVSPGGPAGGDLGGSYPDPTVDGLCGKPLNCSAIGMLGDEDRKVLTWNGSAWVPWGIVGDGTTTTVTAGMGNFTISANNTSAIWNADKLRGTAIDPDLSPSDGDVLKWDAEDNRWEAAPVPGDNWGTQVVVIDPAGPLTGNGTSGNALDVAVDGTTILVNGSGQLAADNTTAQWNADKLQGTAIDPGLSPLAGQVLQWDGSKWTAAGIGAAGGWAVGGNALTSNGSLGTTTNYAVIFITNNTEAMRLTTDQRLDFQGGSGSYRIDLPNSTLVGVGRIRANSFATYSSLRWKEDIRPIGNALERAMALRGVNFRWKPEYGGREDMGFILEEVDRVVPEVVDRDERTGELLGMDYSRLTALLVEALKQHVRTQEQVNARLQQENAELRQRVERLESLVEQLLRQNGERGAGSQPSTIHDAWLGQNIPNPFAGTTTIPYYVPAGVSRAELVVRDVGGRELRRLEVGERGAHGQVVLEMGLLGSGTYEYALVLDGRVVAVKQMTLMR